jgi:hypothetical protein
MLSGSFPYWDPYMTSGTYFYPNISHQGLLDPIVLLCVFFMKIFNINPLTAYIYFRLIRLFIFIIGSFYLFRHITGCKRSAVIAAGVLLFAVSPSYFRQNGVVDNIFLTPFAMYFLLLFFEHIEKPIRYLYMAIVTLITGITMNVFIPSFYLFNLFFFMFAVFIFKILNFSEALKSFWDKRLFGFSLIAALFIIMMSAPPVIVMYKDASAEGELFPMQRIIQKNNLIFKKIMASEISTDALSMKFTGEKGVFSSYGNAVNILYPEMWKSFTDEKDYFGKNDYMSETFQYFGMTPFIFAVIGFLYSKSRFRYVATIMIILISINMFSTYGVNSRPFNSLQSVFNVIFPPLKMAEVRETLSSFFLLYIGMFLSMGLAIFFDYEKFVKFVKKKYKSLILMCLLIIIFKITVTGYFFEKIIFTSIADLFVISQVIFFAVLTYLYFKYPNRQKLLCFLFALVVFTDLYVYNKNLSRHVLKDSSSFYALSKIGVADESGGKFQFFRTPLASSQNVGFGESIERKKGSLSRGYNHSFFTTKRYYDILTHVPLENQFMISGVVYPIVRFFPLEKVKEITDKKALLKHYISASEDEVGDILYVEGDRQESSPSTTFIDMGNFDKFENVDWLKLDHVNNFYSEYMAVTGNYIEKIKKNTYQYMKMPEHLIEIREFSQNDITINVENKKEGYLYYNDGWSKYWRAFDGNREIPIEIANYNFKAVFLESGKHVVHFVFDPGHYRIGLILYYTALLSCISVITFLYIKSKSTD